MRLEVDSSANRSRLDFSSVIERQRNTLGLAFEVVYNIGREWKGAFSIIRRVANDTRAKEYITEMEALFT